MVGEKDIHMISEYHPIDNINYKEQSNFFTVEGS